MSERRANAKSGAAAPARGAMEARLERFAAGRGALLILAAVALAANAFAFDARLNTNGDNAQYLVLGESILAGKGLSHINSPKAEPHTKYPFLYPLVLAGVLAIFPGGLVAAKLVSVVAGVGSVLLVFVLLRARGWTLAALGAALATAVSPHVLEFSRITLAEIVYLFLSLATLIALERALSSPREHWPRLALLLAGIAACYFTKSVGLALAVAAPAAFLARRRFRAALFLLLGFGALSYPWYLRNKAVGQENLYLDYFLMRDPYREGSGTIDGAEFAKRVGANVVKYERFFIPNGFVPQAFTGLRGAPAAERFLFVVPLALTLAGIVLAMRRGAIATELYVLAFLAMIHMWPDVWSGTRFFLPLIPLFFGYALFGVERAGARLFRDQHVRRGARAFALGAAALLVALNVAATLEERGARRGYSADWANFFAAAEWIRDNTPADAIVSSRSSYILYWKTHRKTVGYRFTENAEEVFDDLMNSGARYVLIDNFFWTGTTGRYLVPALQAHQDRFRIVWNAENPPTYVIELLREGEAAG